LDDWNLRKSEESGTFGYVTIDNKAPIEVAKDKSHIPILRACAPELGNEIQYITTDLKLLTRKGPTSVYNLHLKYRDWLNQTRKHQ